MMQLCFSIKSIFASNIFLHLQKFSLNSQVFLFAKKKNMWHSQCWDRCCRDDTYFFLNFCSSIAHTMRLTFIFQTQIFSSSLQNYFKLLNPNNGQNSKDKVQRSHILEKKFQLLHIGNCLTGALCVIFLILVSFLLGNVLFASKAKINVFFFKFL